MMELYKSGNKVRLLAKLYKKIKPTTEFPEFLNLPVVDGSAYLSLYCSDGLGDLHGCCLHVLGCEAVREDGEQGGASC